MTGPASDAVPDPDPDPSDRRPPPPAVPGWLLALTLILLAGNLRTVVITVGPLLRDIQADLDMSDTVAGVLLTLPVLTFGLVGSFAGRVIRRLTPTGTVLLTLVTIALGTAMRGLAPSTGWLLAATLVALSGIAVGNVLAPTLVRAWFPHAVGRATSWYTTALTAGTAVPAALAVPVAAALGGWRPGLAVWSLLAVLVLVPAGVVASRTRAHARTLALGPTSESAADRSLAGQVRRHPVSWALAIFFGVQSLEAYTLIGFLPAILQDAGVPAARAGTLLSIVVAIGAPVAYLLPRLAGRRPDQRPVVVGLIIATLIGELGLVLSPATGTVVWVVLIGIGGGAFPLALLMISLRTTVAVGTAALSSFTQGVGYLIAVIGPLAAGALRDATGAWTVPLSLLLVLLVPKLIAGVLAARPITVDTPG